MPDHWRGSLGRRRARFVGKILAEGRRCCKSALGVAVFFLAGIVAQSAVSQELANNGDVADAEQSVIVPFLPGLGPAVAFHTVDRTPMVDVIVDELWSRREIGIPFDSPNLLYRVRLAIWANGTVLWDAGKRPSAPRYLRGHLKPSAAEQLVAGALAAAKHAPEIDRYSSVAQHGWVPVSLVGVVREKEMLLLHSHFDTMDDLHEKWSWTEPNGSIQDYDSELTQSEYAAAVPAGFRAYLEEWYRRKDHLWAIVPKTGAKIDQQKPVQWIALPVPGGAGGRSQENRKASKRAESTAPLRGSAVQ